MCGGGWDPWSGYLELCAKQSEPMYVHMYPHVCMYAPTCVYDSTTAITPDIVEAHCYIVTTGEQILMSIYVAESINQ